MPSIIGLALAIDGTNVSSAIYERVASTVSIVKIDGIVSTTSTAWKFPPPASAIAGRNDGTLATLPIDTTEVVTS